VRRRGPGRALAQQELLTVVGHVLRSGDYQRMPWKNGGGTTTEIWKAESPAGEMLWRLSIADVASDGPFSEFPGIDRWIMVISGNGMELTIDGMGTKRLDRLYQPLAFSGDATTTCRLLGGPIQDFNFMVRRNFGRGLLQALQLPSNEASPSREDVTAVHVLSGSVELETHDTRELAQGDSWISEEPDRAKVRAVGEAVVAMISIDTTDLVAE
jgi:environmental stress-induced protein Ves